MSILWSTSTTEIYRLLTSLGAGEELHAPYVKTSEVSQGSPRCSSCPYPCASLPRRAGGTRWRHGPRFHLCWKKRGGGTSRALSSRTLPISARPASDTPARAWLLPALPPRRLQTPNDRSVPRKAKFFIKRAGAFDLVKHQLAWSWPPVGRVHTSQEHRLHSLERADSGISGPVSRRGAGAVSVWDGRSALSGERAVYMGNAAGRRSLRLLAPAQRSSQPETFARRLARQGPRSHEQMPEEQTSQDSTPLFSGSQQRCIARI